MHGGGAADMCAPAAAPFYPPAQEVREICSSIDDKDAGADCEIALHQAAVRRASGAGPRLRFQVRRLSPCAAAGLPGLAGPCR